MGDVGSAFLGGFFGGDPGAAVIDEISGGHPEEIFGSRPEVAPYKTIDLGDETGKALAANLENLPDIQALLDKIIPGFSSMLAKGTENTLAELQGQLPPDVIGQIQRSSAFGALQGGYGGTPMAKALTARDLGISSLNLTQAGTNSAQAWANLAEQAYSPFTVSTGQQAGTTAANNAGVQAQQQFEFNVAASPDPVMAGIFAEDQYIGHTFLNFGLGAAGGAIAGAGAGSAAPAGSTGMYTRDPTTGNYIPVTGNTSASSNYYVAPTWGGPT